MVEQFRLILRLGVYECLMCGDLTANKTLHVAKCRPCHCRAYLAQWGVCDDCGHVEESPCHNVVPDQPRHMASVYEASVATTTARELRDAAIARGEEMRD